MVDAQADARSVMDEGVPRPGVLSVMAGAGWLRHAAKTATAGSIPATKAGDQHRPPSSHTTVHQLPLVVGSFCCKIGASSTTERHEPPVPMPATLPKLPERRGRVSVSHMVLAQVVAMLLQSPCTTREIAETTGINRKTAYRLTLAMKKYGATHIGGWRKDALGRESEAVHALGPGLDVPRRSGSRAC